MKIIERTTPIDSSTAPGLNIKAEISTALQFVRTIGDDFVVNDSLWSWRNPQGAIRPTAVNSADYISKKFQASLDEQGWIIEKLIDGQKFDAYKEFPAAAEAYQIAEDNFLDFLKAHYSRHHRELEFDKEISLFYQRLVKRTVSNLDGIDAELHEFFGPAQNTRPLRVGLEFETGNIASSFRALIKLNNLYADDHIDLGVFVTSINKAECAARIWPVSNRNGSFEELDARNFRSNLIVPLWEFGFAPDSFSDEVGYLGQNGELYEMQQTGRELTINGVVYEVWTADRDKEVLRPQSLL